MSKCFIENGGDDETRTRDLCRDSSIFTVTSCNFTAPIATSGALSNPQEVLLHPNRTQIFAHWSCQENALAYNLLFRTVVRTK